MRLILDEYESGPFGTKMISIFIGPKRKEFAVHKKMIVESSQYFQTLLEGEFSEAREAGASNSVYLDEDPTAFEIFINCLYRGGFPADPKLVLGPRTRPLEGMILFYILADKFLLPSSFKLDTFRSFTKTFLQQGYRTKSAWYLPCNLAPAAADINLGLTMLPETDPFHLILLDSIYCVYHQNSDLAANDKWLTTCLENVPATSTTRLCRLLSNHTTWGCIDGARIGFDWLGNGMTCQFARYNTGFFEDVWGQKDKERKKKAKRQSKIADGIDTTSVPGGTGSQS